MNFTVTYRDAELQTRTQVVEARSWYECRDWARAEYGNALRTIEPGGSAPTHIVANMKTCTELAYEHGESLRDAGRREAYAKAYLMLRDPQFTVPEVMRVCAEMGGVELESEVEEMREAAE